MRSFERSEMSENGCVHLSNFKSTWGTQYYRIVSSHFVACTSTEARIRKALSCVCFVCHESGPRLHSCLNCIYFGCFGDHMNTHSHNHKHYLTVDLSYGFVHCMSCSDYVYDEEFLNIAKENKIKQSRCLNIGLSWWPWLYSDHQPDLIKNFTKNHRIISEKSTFGLRGLLNLDKTCYMNSVIQVLVHTPLLRSYFLSEKHKCSSSQDGNNIALTCFICEFGKLFQEFYSGTIVPLALPKLLYFIWNHAGHLATSTEHDVHELFVAIIDLLHVHCQRSASHSVSPQRVCLDFDGGSYKIEKCDCIIDQIFTGELRSDTVCQTCKSVSTKLEPMRDVSLELGDNKSGPSTLLDCLRSYTSAETGIIAKCEHCKDNKEKSKQLSFKSLPVVFCIQLKRFESTKLGKINKKISFPMEIDMVEFMSAPILSQTLDTDSGYGSSSPLLIEDNRYLLFAVVVHVGAIIQNGHYWTYIRHHQDLWFKCNDENVAPASLDDVLKCEGYLLFYHKQVLEYK